MFTFFYDLRSRLAHRLFLPRSLLLQPYNRPIRLYGWQADTDCEAGVLKSRWLSPNRVCRMYMWVNLYSIFSLSAQQRNNNCCGLFLFADILSCPRLASIDTPYVFFVERMGRVIMISFGRRGIVSASSAKANMRFLVSRARQQEHGLFGSRIPLSDCRNAPIFHTAVATGSSAPAPISRFTE